jgi:hypothetical protein
MPVLKEYTSDAFHQYTYFYDRTRRGEFRGIFLKETLTFLNLGPILQSLGHYPA